MELMTVKEVADMLRVSKVTVRRYIASGKLPAVRVGRNIRIRRSEAERVVELTVAKVGQKFVAEDRATYLADAYAGTHEEEAVEAAIMDVDPRFADKSDEWLLENHPWMKFLGVFEDPQGKTDLAENHDKYLAEAYADLHEE